MREPYQNELYHHGILGQKWGVRRYQNPDGSLTEAGKARLSNKVFDHGTERLIKQPKIHRKREEKRVKLPTKEEFDAISKEFDVLEKKTQFNERDKKKLREYARNGFYVSEFFNGPGFYIKYSDTWKEYDKYLENPRKYMEDFARKRKR